MDTARISKIMAEAEAEIAVLDEALNSGNHDTANWTFTILAGIIQDLKRIAEEEPIPAGIDKQKLTKAIQTALYATGEGRGSLEQGDYRLTRSDSVMLVLALDDIQQIINTMSAHSSTTERDVSQQMGGMANTSA